MEKLENLMGRAGSYQGLKKLAEQESLREPVIPPNHPAWDVWQSIKQAYPGPTANWDAEPSVEWAYALDGLSAEQIKLGLRTMVQAGGEFPPSAPSFRQLCGDDWEHARQSRPAHEVLSAPLVDKGEGLLPAPPDNRTPAQILADLKTLF